ncbi:MAG TPA: hypothetical protein VG276_01880 [Actinomycetes bacterium]|nr:hypothetical protein [Actinomycetes bacterium]
MHWSARSRWSWRWLAVLAGVAVLASVPALVAAVPVPGREVAALDLLARVRASGSVAYRGYAESRAGLGLPDVPRAGQVVALLGETTRMRAWVRGPTAWRVDELTLAGERDTYQDEFGTWRWDSGEQRADRTEGEAAVRFARPADLLPPELGRRLAAAAAPDEVRRVRGRRVAGVVAAGLRIVPRSPDTTVGRVDLWADPATGLPLRVEVTARGAVAPILATAFLDLRQAAPGPEDVTFHLPLDAEVVDQEAADMAGTIDRFSPFVLPASLAGLPGRSRVARAAGTFGQGFGLVAVLAFPDRFSRRTRAFLERVPRVRGAWGEASLVSTPLLNGLVFDRAGVAYALAGTVPPRVLERVATQLARDGVAQA